MMKKAIALVAAGMLALVLAGCSSTDEICGTWQGATVHANGRDNVFGTEGATGLLIHRNGVYGVNFDDFSPSFDPMELYMVVGEDGTATLYTDDPSDGINAISWEKSEGVYYFNGCETVMTADRISIEIDPEENASIVFEKISDETEV